MKIKVLLTALLVFSLLCFADAQNTVTKKVAAIHDADGCRFWGETKFVRLMGCDAPEVYSPFVTKSQPFGVESATWLREYVKGKDVFVQEYKKTDFFDRKLVVVVYDGVDLAETLIANGMAHYSYSNTLKKEQRNRYKAAQIAAQLEHKGVWGVTDSVGNYVVPMLPKDWRKANKGKN